MCVCEFRSLIRQHADSTDESPSLLHNLRALDLRCETNCVKREGKEWRGSISIILLHPGYLASHQAHHLHLSPCFLLYHFFISAHYHPVFFPPTRCNSCPPGGNTAFPNDTYGCVVCCRENWVFMSLERGIVLVSYTHRIQFVCVTVHDIIGTLYG